MPTRAQSPAWLCSLLAEKFFTPCLLHELAKKNEKNIFCLDCVAAICPHCLSLHRSHRLLQVRRYVYHDVIRLEDLEKLIDCAFVQAYTTNSAKVVFLNQRPQSRPFKGSGSICNTCKRSLQEPYHFCSLACKVEYLVRCEGSISRYLYDCAYLPLSDLGCGHQEGGLREMDDGQMTPSSILDGEISLRTSSSSGSSGNNGGTAGGATMICTATTEFVRRKRRSGGNSSHSRIAPAPPSVSSALPASSRRKGVPQRSPFF
ncbi:protein RGF1 INDUCIBLE TRANSCRIPTION FACTOR 1-like [Nymphaea colorata]|nr:protein RGF1 INDUCIBLE TRANSCRIPTION FACTOR 1-like [Nymphaea colorata]